MDHALGERPAERQTAKELRKKTRTMERSPLFQLRSVKSRKSSDLAFSKAASPLFALFWCTLIPLLPLANLTPHPFLGPIPSPFSSTSLIPKAKAQHLL